MDAILTQLPRIANGRPKRFMLTSSANTEAVPAISEAALNERITAIVPARDEEEATIESLHPIAGKARGDL